MRVQYYRHYFSRDVRNKEFSIHFPIVKIRQLMKNISEQFWGPNKHAFAFGPQVAIVQAFGSLLPSTLDPRKVQWEKSNCRVALFSVGGVWTLREDSNQPYRHAEMINHNFLPFSYQQSGISILPRGTIIFPHIRAFLWILKFLHLSSNKVHVSSHTYSKHSEPSRNFKNIVSR